MEKIRDLTMLSDILPDRLPRRGVGGRRRRAPRCTSQAPVPSVSRAAASARILGAAVVMIGDMNPERLAHAKSRRLRADRPDQERQARRADRGDHRRDRRSMRRWTPSASRRRGHGQSHTVEAPATVLNSLDDDHARRRDRSASPAST